MIDAYVLGNLKIKIRAECNLVNLQLKSEEVGHRVQGIMGRIIATWLVEYSYQDAFRTVSNLL